MSWRRPTFDHGHDQQVAGGDEAGFCQEEHWSVPCPLQTFGVVAIHARNEANTDTGVF